MAPRNPADDCLFCMPNPCTCNTKKKTTARTARKAIQSTPLPEAPPPMPVVPSVAEQPAAPRPRAGGLRAVKSLATKIERPTATRATVQQAAKQEADDREDKLTAAIRTFAEAGLIDAEELRRHRADMRMADHDFEELISKVRGT